MVLFRRFWVSHQPMLFACVSSPGDRWCDVFCFVPTGSASAKLLNISDWDASHLWWLLCPPVYSLGHFPWHQDAGAVNRRESLTLRHIKTYRFTTMMVIRVRIDLDTNQISKPLLCSPNTQNHPKNVAKQDKVRTPVGSIWQFIDTKGKIKTGLFPVAPIYGCRETEASFPDIDPSPLGPKQDFVRLVFHGHSSV